VNRRSGLRSGIFTGITFPVLVPFDMLTATRTGGQVFRAGITLGITFQVLIPFRTLVDPVLTSRGLAARCLVAGIIIGDTQNRFFFSFRERGAKLVKALLKPSENRPTTLLWSSLACKKMQSKIDEEEMQQQKRGKDKRHSLWESGHQFLTTFWNSHSLTHAWKKPFIALLASR